MSVLHTVNKSPFERNSLDSCLKFAQAGAAVLLIEDGVYAALTGTSAEARVKEALGAVKIYVLGPDLKARGFSDQRVISGIKCRGLCGLRGSRRGARQGPGLVVVINSRETNRSLQHGRHDRSRWQAVRGG